MMYLAYDILLHLAMLFSLPYFLVKMLTVGKYRSGILERLGFMDRKKLAALSGKGPVVWVHAVSVGETRAVMPLLRLMRKNHPDWKIAFSTVTPTGNAVAKSEGAPCMDSLMYFPLDLSWAVKRVVGAVRPDVFVVVEKEFWPNAVRAFNLGFGYAVDRGYEFVFHLNDDAELVSPISITAAMLMLNADESAGCVAFETDFRGDWGFETIHGYTYSNFGLIRTKAGKEVAAVQGDPGFRNWWNPIYKTYAADSEFGCNLHRLGYKVIEGHGLRVHDRQAQDELRELNESDNPDRNDSRLFWSRFPDRDSIARRPFVHYEVVG